MPGSPGRAGRSWTFAPTLTVPQDGRWGRSYEGYSQNPALVAQYAAAVVGESLRRRVESAGHALKAMAQAAPESDLRPMVDLAVNAISDCDLRLRTLRGDPL